MCETSHGLVPNESCVLERQNGLDCSLTCAIEGFNVVLEQWPSLFMLVLPPYVHTIALGHAVSDCMGSILAFS